jgi:ATP-binding cassette subfamily B protein
VLDRGAIVEIGNHEDLMARGGAYYDLYEAQTRQVDAENPLEASAPGEKI